MSFIASGSEMAGCLVQILVTVELFNFIRLVYLLDVAARNTPVRRSAATANVGHKYQHSSGKRLTSLNYATISNSFGQTPQAINHS